ncbi:Deoxyhypusine synthase [Entomophthora muscae]|uniref:Deoxyhypusine synthase n=1 Tax=Entomophthora muscae TaxID=34485 RepID=A0ACC2TNV1_9FUNG|nr:Deoxyhypusine synthase [Entomophthora muscae]
MMQKENDPLNSAKQAVLQSSVCMPAGSTIVEGYDFEANLESSGTEPVVKVDYEALFKSYLTTGFQATNFGKAVNIINNMRNWRLSDEPILANESEEFKDEAARAKQKCKIFLGYTSNLISSGLRENFKYLAKNKMVDVIVTTAGGVEEDFIKCLGPTYLGAFDLEGKALRKQGLNRIGNLLVPNDNYCKFEDWVLPILDQMLIEQREQGVTWTPSKVINRLGKEINHPDSVYYWAYKNNIPVYCPALTDGSLGDMLYFHSHKNPGLIIDIVNDIKCMNDEAVFQKKTGVIILGGGVVKHHICNANLMRNGADYAVYINTGQEFDGSDAGAQPEEAISWGKIQQDGEHVKIHADATLIFPLIVSQTFAQKEA